MIINDTVELESLKKNGKFGGDIMISGEKPYIVWEAHPNIQRNREMGIGAGRKLTDTALIDELKEILVSRVK